MAITALCSVRRHLASNLPDTRRPPLASTHARTRTFTALLHMSRASHSRRHPLIMSALRLETSGADFASESTYQAYASHPVHAEVIKALIKPIIEPGSRTAVQFSLVQASL